ncbi:HAD family hydrolase [Devosia oryzisoli]|uniref:HAD family hydrolase n=1 Tax=Devosia oryzisoli TaxID=2774138 RepID=UPI0031F5C612
MVLFDLDGTLVHHVNPRVLQALEFLDDCSHRTGRLAARFRLARRQCLTAEKKAPKLLVHRAIHRVRRKSVEDILVPCATMQNVLERLRDNGVAMGVVSNGLGRGYGHEVLEAFDLQKFFATCVFREDVVRGKPWPDSILAAVNQIRRMPRRNDEIWYIGDQRKDIRAVQAASAALGVTIRPFALGARAALAAVEARLHPAQIMLTPGDFERAVNAAFRPLSEEAELPLLGSLP